MIPCTTPSAVAHRPRRGRTPTPPAPAENGRHVPPAWVRPLALDVDLIEALVEHDKATKAVLKVALQLRRSAARYGQPGTYVYQATIAKATRLGRSTVRGALLWLERFGAIARSPILVRGEPREMIWCCDLLRAENGAPGADSCAQKTAPEYLNWSSLQERSETLTLAAPGGGGTPDPATVPEATPPLTPAAEPAPAPPPRVPMPVAEATPPLTPAAEPAAAPPRVPMPVAECLAMLASANPRWPALVGPALWDLLDQGQALPSPWDRVKLPARSGDELPPPVRTDPPPGRYFVPTNAGTGKAAVASTIEDLLRRLPASGDRATPLVDEVARRLGELFRDARSINGFKPKLLLVARGEIPLRSALRALKIARNCGPDATPGAIFHHNLNTLEGGP